MPFSRPKPITTMPNNRRSKVQRLPKAERRHASSKIVVLDAAKGAIHIPSVPGSHPASAGGAAQVSGPVLVQSATPAPVQQPCDLSTTSSGPLPAGTQPVRLPPLPDDVLAKLLVAAGPAAVAAALGVSTQWRRVGKTLIARISRVDLGRMYVGEKGERKAPPTYRQLLQMLQQFPCLNTLVIRNWLYQDVMEDVASHVCANYKSQSLESAEFAGVSLRLTDLRMILQQCPNLRRLRLENHTSVDEALLKGFASSYPSIDKQICKGLQSIILARCPNVRREGVSQVLQHVKPAVLTITRCNDLRRLHWKSTRVNVMEKFTATNCNNLNECLIDIPDGRKGVSELNLSQCPKLGKIRISGRADVFAIGLRKLNLSGCGVLSDWQMSDASETLRFDNMEELNLFGVNKLSPESLSRLFGFDSGVCQLPSLRKLDMNGSRISTLKLIGYENLVSVNLSGCPELSELEIRDSWGIESLNVTGRKAPLRSVNLILPTKCVVSGKRRHWYWEGYASNQTFLYP